MKKYPVAGPWKMREVEEVLDRINSGKQTVTRARLSCHHIKTAYHGMAKGWKVRCYLCGHESAQLRGDIH